MAGLADDPSHKPVPRTLSHGTCYPPGRQNEPQSGDALLPPLQRQVQGRDSTTPDPLTSQGFCWVPESLAEPRPASKPAYTDCRRYFSMRGPGSAHSPYFSMEPVGVPCPVPTPVPPQGQARTFWHTHSPASPALSQARKKASGSGTQTWHLVGPVVVAMGAVRLRAGLEVLGHTR